MIYADSRGLNLTDARGKSPFGTYVARLERHYHVTSALCPESHTTILDFLSFAEGQNLDHYAAVVMHCGIVDFSPRPVSNIDKVRAGKHGLPQFDELFSRNAGYHADPTRVDYHGEPTINLYSSDYLRSSILPRLLDIPNLVWIDSNHFVPGWEGNYSRGRPANIQEFVSRFEDIMVDQLPHVVDLKGWSPEEVKQRTIDNIHFTLQGFAVVAESIAQTVTEMCAGARASARRS
jgi:hypothetical protein